MNLIRKAKSLKPIYAAILKIDQNLNKLRTQYDFLERKPAQNIFNHFETKNYTFGGIDFGPIAQQQLGNNIYFLTDVTLNPFFPNSVKLHLLMT